MISCSLSPLGCRLPRPHDSECANARVGHGHRAPSHGGPDANLPARRPPLPRPRAARSPNRSRGRPYFRLLCLPGSQGRGEGGGGDRAAEPGLGAPCRRSSRCAGCGAGAASPARPELCSRASLLPKESSEICAGVSGSDLVSSRNSSDQNYVFIASLIQLGKTPNWLDHLTLGNS